MSDIEAKTYPPEFLQRLIADHEAEQAGATPEDSSAVQTKGDAMSEIKRFDIPRNGKEFLHEDPDGEYVQYDDHRAEVERLTAERDNAQAADDMALSALTSVLRQRYAAQAEIKRMQAALTEAHDRCRALELAVEQADEMKAHAEASVAAEEAETDRVTAERDAAQAEVERLTQELEGRRATNQRVMAERDAAKREAERLQTLLTVERGELITLRDSLRVLRANGQGMRDTSRPTDEDIWREAFMAAVHDVHKNWMDVADVALAQYRKRWPR